METRPEATIADDILRGIEEIATFIGEDRHRTYRLCANGVIPAGKQGGSWRASKKALKAHYGRLIGGEASSGAA